MSSPRRDRQRSPAVSGMADVRPPGSKKAQAPEITRRPHAVIRASKSFIPSLNHGRGSRSRPHGTKNSPVILADPGGSQHGALSHPVLADRSKDGPTECQASITARIEPIV